MCQATSEPMTQYQSLAAKLRVKTASLRCVCGCDAQAAGDDGLRILRRKHRPTRAAARRKGGPPAQPRQTVDEEEVSS